MSSDNQSFHGGLRFVKGAANSGKVQQYVSFRAHAVSRPNDLLSVNVFDLPQRIKYGISMGLEDGKGAAGKLF